MAIHHLTHSSGCRPCPSAHPSSPSPCLLDKLRGPHRAEPGTGGTGHWHARTSTTPHAWWSLALARAAARAPRRRRVGDDHHHMLHEQQAPPAPAVAAAPPPVPSAPTSPAASSNHDEGEGDGDSGVRDVEVTTFRDIHPLTPDPPTPPHPHPARTGSWDTASHRSLSSEEQFMTMSREFTAMVAAGATMHTGGGGGYDGGGADQLTSIGEDELEETNPLAIVPDTHPIAATPARSRASAGLEVVPAAPAPTPPQPPAHVEASQVKKEEVETKVSAWQTAEVAKINNRFKREEVVINGWETEQVDKASAWLKKIERKLDEQRAKAVEKTQNDIAKARRKAEDKRASAEAKRGLKLAKVLELANFMKAVGRVPTKRSFF